MRKYLVLLILSSVFTVRAQTIPFEIYTVDDNFPGGNIVIDSIAGNKVLLHQDLNDTEASNWFYWNFRVKGAAGKTLTFEFTHPWGNERKLLNVIGVRGPGISLDSGKTWDWMGTSSVEGTSFYYKFLSDQNDVRFSFGMPYTSEQLVEFLKKYKNHPNLDVNNLSITRAGRLVERLHLGNIHGNAKYKIVITARHHASEMMASYVLEGIMKYFLEDNTEGKWFRENVEALIIPFVDKDGVEEGDQGKLRRGRDHNRDYAGESLYASTRALRNYIPVWSKGKMVAGIDLHCPWIRGEDHENIHLVGHQDKYVWTEQQKFSKLFEKETANSLLPYYSTSDIPYGALWNIDTNFANGKSFAAWATSLKEVKLATTIEIPYANSSGKIVNQTSSRALGKDLAKALIDYLKGINKD